MEAILNEWKKGLEREKRYRLCLKISLVFSVIVLIVGLSYRLDHDIPSTIYMRAGEEENICLDIPATGEIMVVSKPELGNVSTDKVTVNLNQDIRMKADLDSEYEMKIKLFGFLPFKQVGIHVIEDEKLVPVGKPVGIYMKADGVLVIDIGEFIGQDGLKHSPSKYVLKSGDYIRKVNGKEVKGKEEFVKMIEECNGEELILSVGRNHEVMQLKVKPVSDQNDEYRLGIWVRDNTQGVGTMTYLDTKGNFGALGHGINDMDTNDIMSIDNGTLYQSEIVSVHRGSNGDPGEMVGMITYADEYILGDIFVNSNQGIFGKCNKRGIEQLGGESIPMGLKQDIEEGNAQILCDIDGTTRAYNIVITDVYLDHEGKNRDLEIKITDSRLLEQTGGIVQGMSGSPVIQNGRIVGAVTHVLVNDPTMGYGIFIENMLKAAK